MLGVFAWLMPLSVAISTFGSANGNIIIHMYTMYIYFFFNTINLSTMNSLIHFYIQFSFQVPFLQLVDFAMLPVEKAIYAIFYLLSIRTI
jgi:hypothetical protein